MDVTAPVSRLREGWLEGTGSPRALLETYLERIAAREPEVKAFAFLDAESARAAADAASARYRDGKPLSAIDGLPIGLKDNLETADMPTGFGSPIFAGRRSGRDSAVAHALREAGAVIVGKTVTTEFAATQPTADTCNPHDPRRTPGGSSSGSAAAVGAGMLPIAIGTQVIGSVLRPAGFCGVIGFKPTYGALNKGGSSDAYSQNCVGMLARRLDDAWAVCHEIAARVGGDPGFPPFRGGPAPAPAHKPRRLAVLETAGWTVAEDGAKSAFHAALDRLRTEGIELIDRRGSARIEALERAIAPAREVSTVICAYEALWPFAELANRHFDGLSTSMQERVALARRLTPDEYAAALLRREEMRNALLSLTGEVDAFVTLANAGPAPIGLESTGNPIFNVPFSALRVPSLSLPLLTVDGLPVGFQLAGFPYGERQLSAQARYILDMWGGDLWKGAA